MDALGSPGRARGGRELLAESSCSWRLRSTPGPGDLTRLQMLQGWAGRSRGGGRGIWGAGCGLWGTGGEIWGTEYGKWGTGSGI